MFLLLLQMVQVIVGHLLNDKSIMKINYVRMNTKVLCLLLMLFTTPVFADSDPCAEYKHIKLAVAMFPRMSSMIFDLSNNGTIESPYVDSVWILSIEQEPVQKLYAQSGDTIDISFLEENKKYILSVYIDGCIKSRVFYHRVLPTDLENNTIYPLPKGNFFYYKGVLYYEAPNGKRYDILGRKL